MTKLCSQRLYHLTLGRIKLLRLRELGAMLHCQRWRHHDEPGWVQHWFDSRPGQRKVWILHQDVLAQLQEPALRQKRKWNEQSFQLQGSPFDEPCRAASQLIMGRTFRRTVGHHQGSRHIRRKLTCDCWGGISRQSEIRMNQMPWMTVSATQWLIATERWITR